MVGLPNQSVPKLGDIGLRGLPKSKVHSGPTYPSRTRDTPETDQAHPELSAGKDPVEQNRRSIGPLRKLARQATQPKNECVGGWMDGWAGSENLRITQALDLS